MRRMIVALAAALLAFPAFAADKGAPPSVAAVDALPDAARPFHGLYVGAVAGAAAGSLRDAEGFRIPRDGLTAGGLIGYSARISGVPGLVLGAEADLSATDISGSTSVDGFRITGSSKMLGSVRARAGVVMGQTLLYATGGLAVSNAELAVQSVGNASNNHVRGLVYGVGIEAVILGNLAVRVEGLQFDWRGAGFASDAFDAGRVRSEDRHIRAGLIVRL